MPKQPNTILTLHQDNPLVTNQSLVEATNSLIQEITACEFRANSNHLQSQKFRRKLMGKGNPFLGGLGVSLRRGWG